MKGRDAVIVQVAGFVCGGALAVVLYVVFRLTGIVQEP